MVNDDHLKGSPYKVLNELEQQIQDDYLAIVLNMSKAIMTEINEEIRSLKENEIF